MRPLAALLAIVPLLARADEGMWTFDAFPSAKVEQAYGFSPSREWLDHVRLASARLAFGCSGSFVSAQGLVMTNQHCAHACIEQLSTAGDDLVRSGFLARTAEEERRCPDLEVDQLTAISDVTPRVRAATRGREGEAYQRALRAATAAIERECQTSAALRCDVVSLYHGGLYHLYRYRRFQDVRLVFAPELAIAYFGGDPDNFMFPRYDLDVAFLRVYDAGRPARLEHWFRWSAAGAKAGELTFVTGHPGGTLRALTAAQLRTERDLSLPDELIRLAESRGLVTGFRLLGDEEKRISTEYLLSLENSFKALRGQLEALQDPAFFHAKEAAEEAFKAELAKDPERGARVLPAFAAIEKAQARLRQVHEELVALEHGLGGELASLARTLLRAAEERTKPDGERLREYRESNMPALAQEVLSEAPIYPQLEKLRLGHALSKIRETLGADHPAVKKLLGKESPEEVAARAVEGTRLRDVAVRRALWEGGKRALDASQDPMIALVRRLEPDARSVRKLWEDEVDAVVKRNEEIIAEARFAVQGRTTYPDATFTLRLTYGQVKGWKEGTREVAPFTTFAGAFERHTGRDPFALPASWLAAKDRLDLSTPFDFVTTNDVVGGNSGSPVINRHAEIVGLVFDGNIHSLGGEYGFDAAKNRAVAVDSTAIIEALARIYGARRIVDECLGRSTNRRRAAPRSSARARGERRRRRRGEPRSRAYRGRGRPGP